MLANLVRTGDGATIDADQLTEEVLDSFRRVLVIREYEPSLRLRIAALIRELTDPPST